MISLLWSLLSWSSSFLNSYLVGFLKSISTLFEHPSFYASYEQDVRIPSRRFKIRFIEMSVTRSPGHHTLRGTSWPFQGRNLHLVCSMARSLSTFLLSLQAYLLISHGERVGVMSMAHIGPWSVSSAHSVVWSANGDQTHMDVVRRSCTSLGWFRRWDSRLPLLRTSGGILYLLYSRDRFYLWAKKLNI